jgi:pimeloyl-ACP methyl ester carboxylesterase
MNVPPAASPSEPDRGSSRKARFRFSRRGFVSTATAATGASLLGGLSSSAASGLTSAAGAGPDGFGSVATAPRLPAGFARTFRSRHVQANGIRQHAVVGGSGPALLLVHGWPENWYAWRFLMPTLATSYTVVAVDQRGIGLSEKATSGYDSATLANDLAALMTKLGHEKFAVVGHDTGMVVSYALAADHRDRVASLAVAEIPGPPGVQPDPTDPPPPPMFVPEQLNNKLWHIPFNRVDDDLVLDMVKSNANAYYRYEYKIQGGGATLPDYAIEYYIKLYTRDRATLRASFGLYRAWDSHMAQNAARQATPLTIPVLGIGGVNSWGTNVAEGMLPAAPGVQTAVIPGAGHWIAEQNAVGTLDALTGFLAPYRAAA